MFFLSDALCITNLTPRSSHTPIMHSQNQEFALAGTLAQATAGLRVLDYEALLRTEFQVQTVRKVAIHICDLQEFHFPLAAARDQALQTFEPFDLPGLLMKLPSLDQVN